MAAEIITKEDLQAFKLELLSEIKSFISKPLSESKRMRLKSEDVRKMLGISPGSLQNLRDFTAYLPFQQSRWHPLLRLFRYRKEIMADNKTRIALMQKAR